VFIKYKICPAIRRPRIREFEINAPIFDSQGQSLYATISIREKVYRLDHSDIQWIFEIVGSLQFVMPVEVRNFLAPDTSSCEIEFRLETSSFKFFWEYPTPNELRNLADLSDKLYDFACKVEKSRNPI
jgi:hypothetical protein